MRYSALKGMEDILPPQTSLWRRVETTAARVFLCYGYQEARVPIVESTELFVRSIGESTDIVEKEMYTFRDRADRSLTLRPEGTAPLVRCYIEHSLFNLPSPQKFYYSGPMFRYERPQKGRFRQFYQIGAEAFGVAHPSLDAEILVMVRNLLEAIGLKGLALEINSIGCPVCRPEYREALLFFLGSRKPDFCADCQRRYEINPLRILDCKIARCIELRKGAPAVTDFLCSDCRSHFDELLKRLNKHDISYTLNPNLVRGLDYYTRTTFEVTSEHLGAQKAVAAGGRYDRLVEEFGGPPTPAIGFAIGMERIVTLLQDQQAAAAHRPKVFIAALGQDAELAGTQIAEEIRKHGHWVETSYGGGSLKSQMRKADRLGSKNVLIIGENELKDGKIVWKSLGTGEQATMAVAEAISKITQSGRGGSG